MVEAHQPDGVERLPHPAAKRVLSLRQNDLVAVEPNGQDRKIMRVVKFSGGGQITFAEHQEAGPLKARDAASSDIDPFKYFYSSAGGLQRSEEHTSELQSLMRISYAVFCLKKKT